jgi:hypothetical protein
MNAPLQTLNEMQRLSCSCQQVRILEQEFE